MIWLPNFSHWVTALLPEAELADPASIPDRDGLIHRGMSDGSRDPALSRFLMFHSSSAQCEHTLALLELSRAMRRAHRLRLVIPGELLHRRLAVIETGRP